MEVSIFTRPEIRKLLEQFVEIRLHVDTGERAAELKEYAVNLVKTSGIPVYAIVDPERPNVAQAIFNGADPPSGSRFKAWLESYLASH